jgi:hypothetical protein
MGNGNPIFYDGEPQCRINMNYSAPNAWSSHVSNNPTLVQGRMTIVENERMSTRRQPCGLKHPENQGAIGKHTGTLCSWKSLIFFSAKKNCDLSLRSIQTKSRRRTQNFFR